MTKYDVENQIERKVERFMDHLDRLFLAGAISKKDYDLGVKDLDEWAKAKAAEGK